MRKIGELKGKPIIEGNPNEIKKNQIHYKESDGNITLSERKEDNTFSSVTSGSDSGEGGVKEYYYKIKNNYVLQGITVGMGLCNITAIITNYYGKSIENTHSLSIAVEMLNIIDNGKLQFNAFKYTDIEVIMIEASTALTITKSGLGNLNERLYNYWINSGNVNEEMYNQLKQAFELTFEKITKEEYESMITYKPE